MKKENSDSNSDAGAWLESLLDNVDKAHAIIDELEGRVIPRERRPPLAERVRRITNQDRSLRECVWLREAHRRQARKINSQRLELHALASFRCDKTNNYITWLRTEVFKKDRKIDRMERALRKLRYELSKATRCRLGDKPCAGGRPSCR